MMAPPDRPRGHGRAARISERVYRTLLRAYPRGLRDEYGDEMVRLFRDQCREGLENGLLGLVALWGRTLPELLRTALEERRTMVDRNAYRAIVGVALATASILLVPLLVAPAWTPADFVAAGALIFGTGLAYVLVVRRAGNVAYRSAVGVALAAAFVLVWLNLAVGIIGSSGDPANLMYGGVLAVGIVGALVARFGPRGMARALFATALAQALVAVIAPMIGRDSLRSLPEVLGLLAINGFFVALFLGSARLFRNAARGQAPAGAGPEV